MRHVFVAAFGYLAFALVLVYVVAPIRGFVGQRTMAEQLRYASERWLATAVYDAGGSFVGTYDARLDSMKDVNYTDAAITVGEYVANPDHKSIPVRVVPDAYWQCLSWHEDRYIGGWLNPAGIDLIGVLKIPYTSIIRTIQTKRPHLGVGGSTLPMQFARVIYKTPPSSSEGGLTKLRRKLGEWWLAPVIYHTLTQGGDDTPLKQWAANHIWLAQRTGGQPLHGIEVTSQIVFGKEASELTTAEQFVLGERGQQADHSFDGRRQAECGADGPVAVHHGSACKDVCREAAEGSGGAEQGAVRVGADGGGAARSARQTQDAAGARNLCAVTVASGASQSEYPDDGVDAGRPLRAPGRDEVGLRFRVARLRARRDDDTRCDREPRVSREGQSGARQDRCP